VRKSALLLEFWTMDTHQRRRNPKYAPNMTSSEHFGSDSQKSWSYFQAYNIINKAKYTFLALYTVYWI
jgi:hypothetical protein